MAASTGMIGLGAYLEIGDGGSPSETFTEIANVTNLNPGEETLEEGDFTHLGSTGGRKEFKPSGFFDDGQVTFTIQYDPTNSTHTLLRTKFRAKTTFNFRIGFPNKSKRFVGAGFITSLGNGGDISTGPDPVTTDVTIRITNNLDLEDIS